MNTKSAFLLFIPGFFQIRQGHIFKGVLMTSLFFVNLFLYILTQLMMKEGSLFLFLALASVLFYLLDLIESRPLQEEEEIISENPYEDGRIAMMTLDYDRSEKLFLTASSRDPADMDVVFQLAVLYRKKGDLSKTRHWLKKYLRQKKHSKWIQDAQKILKEMDHAAQIS